MSELQIGELKLHLNRKAIKNLHISVLPPHGLIRVSAPQKMSETAIRLAVIEKIPWIKKQQEEFKRQPRQSDREMVSGECHYLWGKKYRLVLVEEYGKHEVSASGQKLVFTLRPGTKLVNKKKLLDRFYREQLVATITKIAPLWEKRLGVDCNCYTIRKMKTMWGSCNTSTRCILLNVELAKKPLECVEYILVHELAHLLERKHNRHFREIIEQVMPNWEERRSLLAEAPLSHNEWKY